MVIRLFLFLIIFFPWVSFADTKLTAGIDPSQSLTENTPIKGTIMITHSPNDKVDDNSFTIDGKSFAVNHTQEVPLGPTEVISIYSFQLPGKPKGLYVLGEIDAKVGSTKLASVPSSYEILAGQPAQAATPTSPQAAPQAAAAPVVQPSLKLEQQVEAPDPFYPGRRGTLIYRYIYSGDIELTKEDLPLMKADGFLKIGEEEIKDYTQGNDSVRQISQTIQASKPGSFHIQGAVVEGKAYTTDRAGNRAYAAKPLHAETPALTIVVKPLPNQDKPASFTGAVGKYTFDVKLTSPKEMDVGDKLTLGINIGGPKDTIANVQLPDLCCFPGMSGLFQLSDLPPSSVVKDNVKQFTVEMRPLSANAKEIPSLEFSYFDPDSQKFVTLKSNPIPITVRAIAVPKPAAKAEPPEETEAPKPVTPQAIEIVSNYPLAESDLSTHLFGGWSVYWLIPFGIALILAQRAFRQNLEHRQLVVKPVTSDMIFKEAMAQKHDSPEFYQKINKAFLLRLYERGEIPSADVSLDELPEIGAPGEVRKYLSALEEERFSGKKQTVDGKQAEVLFAKLASEKRG